MNVFMIGGTGLIGSQAAYELIARGHKVSTLRASVAGREQLHRK